MQRDFGHIVSDLLSGCTGRSPEPVVVQCPAATGAAPRPLLPASTSAAVMYPHPDSPAWFPVHDEHCQFLGRFDTTCEAWGRLATVKQLAPSIAEHLGVGATDVIGLIARSSDNILPLADSREGVAVLTLYVAKALGIEHGERWFLPSVQ